MDLCLNLKLAVVCFVQILGTPTESTWPGITKNNEFVNAAFPVYLADPLSTHAPRLAAENDAIDLLEQLLRFESKNRVPALEAMRHPYFEALGQRVCHLANSKCYYQTKTDLVYLCTHVVKS